MKEKKGFSLERCCVMILYQDLVRPEEMKSMMAHGCSAAMQNMYNER